MALKEMGLTLEQISQMLTAGVSTDEIQGMLRLKQAEIQQKLREDQKRLNLVEFRLRIIDAATGLTGVHVFWGISTVRNV